MSIASICCTRTVLICTACPSANATSTGCAASRTHRSSNRSRQEPNFPTQKCGASSQVNRFAGFNRGQRSRNPSSGPIVRLMNSKALEGENRMFRPSLALVVLFMLVAPSLASARDATASAKSQSTNARVVVKDRRTAVQRRVGYRAEAAPMPRNCGEFMYWKDGKCNDARNKSSSWRAF